MADSNEHPEPAAAISSDSAGTHRPRLFLRCIFLLLGVGVLVPWNAFISAKGYFQSRFCDPNDPSESSSTMESTFVFVYTLSSVISLGMIMVGQWAFDQWKRRRRGILVPNDEEEDGIFQDSETGDDTLANQENEECESNSPDNGNDDDDQGALQSSPVGEGLELSEIPMHSHGSSSSMWFDVIPLSCFLLVFIGQTILVLAVQISSPHSIAFWTYLSLGICGVCSSMATAGIVAVAGRFEDADLAMNPFLAGQSVGGVIVSIANFAAAVSRDPSEYWENNCSGGNQTLAYWSYNTSLLTTDENPSENSCDGYDKVDWGIFVYFFLGSFVLICCLIGFSWIESLRKQIEDGLGAEEESEDILRGYQRTGSSLRGVELLRPIGNEDSGSEQQNSSSVGRPTSRSHLLGGPTTDNFDGSPAAAASSDADAPNTDILKVLTIVRGPTACIFLTFLVTLALFPGWTSALGSVRQCKSHLRLANDLYTPFSFVLFNIGDLIGRLLAGYTVFQSLLSSRLVVASLLRVVFFPLLFLCTAVTMGDAEAHLPLGFQVHSDIFSLAVQLAFSVSNGLVLTAAFAAAPSKLPRDNEKMNERMSEILSFSVALGLLSGGLCSFPVSKLVA